MIESQLLHDLLHNQLLSHPLPWTIEQDWTWEVTAADGALIAKCPSYERARALVDAAEEMARKSLEAEECIEREMQLLDEDLRTGRKNRCRYFGCSNDATHEDLVDADSDAMVMGDAKTSEEVYTRCCASHAGPRAQLLGTKPSLHP